MDAGIPGFRLLRRLLRNLQQAVIDRVRIPSRHRDVFFLTGDIATAFITTLLVLWLSGASGHVSIAHRLFIAGVAGALIPLANLALGNYRLAWVTFSLRDLRRLFAATTLATVTLALLTRAPVIASIAPNPLLWGMALFFALATFRGSRRLLFEPLVAQDTGKRALIVISARDAYFLPNVMRRLSNFRYNIVGIVDPDPTQVGCHEQGIEVVGTTADAEAIIEKYRVKVVIVMLEAVPGFELGDFYARLQRLGTVEVKTMPSLVDVLDDRSDLGALERFCIHEITGRPPVQVDVNEMRRVFGDRRGRVDRFRTLPPALPVRPGEAGPVRAGRLEPVLRRPRDPAEPSRARRRAVSRRHHARTGFGPGIRRRAPGDHLPRRRVQARPDPGVSSPGRGADKRPRLTPGREGGDTPRRPVLRLRIDRQGGQPDQRHGCQQTARRDAGHVDERAGRHARHGGTVRQRARFARERHHRLPGRHRTAPPDYGYPQGHEALLHAYQ